MASGCRGLMARFLVAYSHVLFLHTLMEPGKFRYLPGLFTLLSPVAGQLLPLYDLIVVYLIILVSALPVLLALRDYGHLVNQSRARIIVQFVLALLAGISLMALISFALKYTKWSRLFVVLFMLLSTMNLSVYRLLLRQYFLLRKYAGVYASNVLIVGRLNELDWMIHYFIVNTSAEDFRLVGKLCPQDEEETGVRRPTWLNY